MTWLKQLGIVALGCSLAAVMVVLGLWQLRVFNTQGAAASAARAAEPARDLGVAAPPGVAISDGYGRTVRFAGRYLADRQYLVPLEGQADRLRVLTGFRTTDGRVLAVVRGTIPTTTPSAPPAPSGTLTQTGLLLPSEDAAGPAPDQPGRLASVRIPALAQTWPPPLVEGYVVLSGSDAAAQALEPAPVVLPEARGRLRNGAYALQWWVFAAFAIGMAARIAGDLRDRELDSGAAVDPR